VALSEPARVRTAKGSEALAVSLLFRMALLRAKYSFALLLAPIGSLKTSDPPLHLPMSLRFPPSSCCYTLAMEAGRSS
jgi:hypothetical protein